MAFSLIDAAAQFEQTMRKDNPARSVPANVKLTMFMQHVQGLATDMDEWSEEEWIEAMAKFGITDLDAAIMLLEDVASWGMVDNFEWATPLEVVTGADR